MSTDTHTQKIHIFIPDRNRIEGAADQQLRQIAGLPGVVRAAGFPDLHPGKGAPVGSAFLMKNRIYPHVPGSDMGCGISLWLTDLSSRKTKRDNWARKLKDLEAPWNGDTMAWLNRFGLNVTDPNPALGTIGGGNHFAELQKVNHVADPDTFRKMGMDASRLYLTVHSGSRSLGQALFDRYARLCGAAGLDVDSDAAAACMDDIRFAGFWAKANRALIAHRFLEQLRADGTRLTDHCHNNITCTPSGLWLHRKGAAPSDEGPVMVPGTRGSFSYLVRPLPNNPAALSSIAHGAGRKWNRSSCRDRVRQMGPVASLTRTSLGSRVICEDRELLMEEVPQAYKNIDRVIGDMVETGLVSVIARFRPVITYKTRKGAA